MTNTLYKLLAAFLVVMLLIFVIAYSYEATRAEQSTEALADLQKELRHTTDELGRTTSTAHVVELERNQLLKLTADQETTLWQLQTAVKQNPKARGATVFTAATTGKASGKTDTIKHVATDSTGLKMPEYKGSIKRADIVADIRANQDSVFIDSYTVYSSFELVETYERQKWYERKDLVLKIKPLNPNTKVTDAKTWRKPERKRYTGLKVAVAAVAAFITGAYVL